MNASTLLALAWDAVKSLDRAEIKAFLRDAVLIGREAIFDADPAVTLNMMAMAGETERILLLRALASYERQRAAGAWDRAAAAERVGTLAGKWIVGLAMAALTAWAREKASTS